MAKVSYQETKDFFEAIRKGDLNKVQVYVSNNSTFLTLCSNGLTPLIVAIYSKNFDVIKYLIQKGANVNCKDSSNHTPLGLAISKNCSLDIIKLLINNNAEINQMTHYDYTPHSQYSQYTPLSVSIICKNLEVAKLLIDKGADMYKQNSDKTTALSLVQKYNNVDILIYYYTPLGYAIFNGKLDEARQLLEEGADVCISGASKKIPLVIAVEKGNLEAVKLLFEFGADFTMPTALLQAINVGNLEMIDFYIKNNVVINYEHRDGTTPLIKAIRKGNFEVVKILFENGAHVNFKSSHGSYPLFEALKLDNCDIIKYLLSKEAKMNGKCLMKDNFQCVKNLIKYKIELKTVLLGDLEPSTLLKGVETKNALFVKYLLKQGLSINSYDDKQKSPLAVAVKNHSVLIVKILIDAGARIDSAKEELKELANKNDEFYIYYQSLKLNLNKPTLFSEGFGSGAHEAAD